MKSLFFILLILVTTPSIAQTPDSLATTPKFAVRWTTFSLASRFPALQFGVEYRLKSLNPRWTMSHDLGIVLNTGNDTESYANTSGFKANTELRYYVIPSGRVPFYASTELHFQQVKYDRTELVGYDCENGECSYYQYIAGRRDYTMQRASLRLGLLIFLDSDERVFLDLAAGIGYRIRRSRDINKPPLAPNGRSFGTDTKWPESSIVENEETFAPVASFRLGYRFK